MDCNSSKIQEPWDGNSSTGVLWQPQELCPLCSHSWQFTTATEWWPLLETGKQLIVPCHCSIWWEQLFIQLPVSIPCACNLAMLGICLVSLNSCAEAHMESIDGIIFELLLTDFCYLSCSHKEVCICGGKSKIQACTLLIIWLFCFKHMFRKAKLFENSGHGLFPILKLDASKLIWQEARSFLIALSILYSQTTEITQPLKTFSIFLQVHVLIN